VVGAVLSGAKDVLQQQATVVAISLLKTSIEWSEQLVLATVPPGYLVFGPSLKAAQTRGRADSCQLGNQITLLPPTYLAYLKKKKKV
jgi:hypothetical protein